MLNQSIYFRFTFTFLICTVLPSCSLQTSKQPAFASTIDTVIIDIKKIIDAKEIKFTVSEQTSWSYSYGLLEVEIIDPPVPIEFNAIPKDDSTLQRLGKRISLALKRNLKDPEEYRYYAVKFTYNKHTWFNWRTTKSYSYESSKL